MRKGWKTCAVLLAAILAALLASASAVPLHAQAVLRVAAAADLEPVLPAVLARFQQSTGIRAEATYKSSAVLTSQIINGAPFDVFLSADLGFPQRLIAAGLAVGNASGQPVTYAKGTLVLWERNDAHLPPPSLDLLRGPAIRRLAIANPENAPYGRAAVAALRSLNLYAAFQPRLATAENIAQAAQFVYSANADAGLISMTSALTPQLRQAGTYFILPFHLYPPLNQGAVLVKSTTQRAAAQKLLDALLSPSIQAELAKGGLTPVH